MERSEAIKILTKAGRSNEVREILSDKAQSAHDAYKEIQDDRDLTPEAKRARQAARYMQVIKGVNDKLITLASKVWLNDKDDASSVFGIKGLDGDPASLAISRRDAADRIAACEGKSAEVRELLRRATRSGDEVLARAAVEWAVESQHADTVNEYLKARPSQDAALTRLWNAERAESGGFEMAMLLSALRPSEMSSMPDDYIEGIAAPAYS